MSIRSFIRRQFNNGVSVTDNVPTGLASGVLSMTLQSGSTFPDGSVGPFIVTIDQGQLNEERILCTSRSGATVTIDPNGRGYNNTPNGTHSNGAIVLHTSDQQDFDEANQAVVQTIGQVQASGDLLVGASANTLNRLARGASNSFLSTVGTALAWVGFGVGQTTAVAASSSDGVRTDLARSDHIHQGVTSFNTRSGAVTLTAADIYGSAPAQLPVGGFFYWGSDTLPVDANTTFLALLGQTVTGGVASYPTLAALYHSWVASNGTDLNMPDSRGHFIKGAANSGDSAGPGVFTTGGSASITLVTGNIPQFANVALSISDPTHNHAISDPGHAHAQAPQTAVSTGSSVGLVATATNQAAFSAAFSTAAAFTGISATNVAGTGISGTVTFGSASPTPLTIDPPWLSLHLIVRAK